MTIQKFIARIEDSNTERCTIFMDPERLESVVQELLKYGLEVIETGGAGPEASIIFLGEKEDIKNFVEENTFEITEDSIVR